MTKSECFEETSDSTELVTRNRVRDNEDAVVRPMFIEKLNRYPDEIISIPGDKAPFLPGGELQLLQVPRL
jgi:hypothetical protein